MKLTTNDKWIIFCVPQIPVDFIFAITAETQIGAVWFTFLPVALFWASWVRWVSPELFGFPKRDFILLDWIKSKLELSK